MPPEDVIASTVPAAVVSSRIEAELIVGLLRSNGLRAAVSAGDAGGQEPQLQLQGGLFTAWEHNLRTRRVAIGDGPLTARIWVTTLNLP